MNITVTLLSKLGEHTFTAVVHEITDPAGFFLDGEFYKKYGGDLPLLPHHEIEITAPGNDFFSQRALHITRSAKTPNPFVCFPSRMETLEQALGIFRIWCAGTLCTVNGGPDLRETYKSDVEAFWLLMKETYGIVIKNESGGVRKV